MITYHDKVFRSVSNSETGEVDAETRFHYHQDGEIVWATYAGGKVRFGTLIAKLEAGDVLDMRYQHVNADGQFMAGECRSVPSVLPDGRLRLDETWRWTTGDRSSGRSVVEEVVTTER